MSELERQIKITTDDGRELDGEILFSFEESGDNFVVYQIEDSVYAAKVDENQKLTPVEEDEWPLVEKIFNEFVEELENERENGEDFDEDEEYEDEEDQLEGEGSV